ncbi:MAG: AAA family ATPase [Ideonella sp.]|nr:AAA family ATPase [Ideonella sp.]
MPLPAHDDPPTIPGPGRAPTLRLRLHGDPVVIGADGVPRALERRAAALCALAVLQPGISRARAAQMLWPDSDDARRALRQQLLRFRKMLEADLLVGEDTLQVAPQVEVAGLGPGDPPAGDLLGGLAYDDCPDLQDWLEGVRRAQRATRTEGLAESLAAAEAQGDLAAAVGWAERLVEADPASELHHRALMRLHYLRGDVAQAQRVYERLVGMLDRQFAARPSRETEQLAQALRTASSGAAAALPEPTAAVAPIPVTVLRPPRLIGRERERAALAEAARSGRTALVLGEPGLGKTRLLEGRALASAALQVQGRPGDAGVPYATLARLLRRALDQAPVTLAPPRRTELARLLPELAPALPFPADGQRLLLQSAIEDLLAHAQMGGRALQAVIVDDLHFADEASVEMLQALVGSAALPTLHWTFAQRPGEGPAAASALRAALEESHALEVIRLDPLSEAELAELVDSLGLPELDGGELAPALHRHTGGNPLYALETLKQALARGRPSGATLPSPVSVGTLIERRLRQLPERALALARVAAIAGVDFGIGLAEQVMQARAIDLTDAWADLEQAQVLRDSAFAHDLVLDAVLRSIPAPISRHLHGAVAAFLETHDGVPARIAAHWLAAGREREALPALHRAAEQARAGLRRREELGFLMTAARIEEAAGELDAAWQTLRAADRAQIAVDPAPSPVLEAARERLARTPERQSELARARSTAQLNAGCFVEAEDQARLAVGAARAAGSARCLAEALSALSMSLGMQGRLLEALLPSDELLGLLGSIESPEPAWFSERGVLLDNLGRPRDARPMHERAVELVLALGDRSQAIAALANLACSLMDAGRTRAALAALDRARSLAQAHDEAAGTLSTTLMVRCSALRDLGAYDQALRAVDAAQALLAEAAPGYVPVVELTRASLWWHLGQLARSQQSIPDESALSGLPGWLLARRWQALARCRHALGEPVGDLLARARALADDGGVQVARDIAALQAAEAAGTLEALDEIQAIGADARRDGRDGVALAAACRGARLAAALGMRHLATTQADAALAVLASEAGPDDRVTPADLGEPEAWLCLFEAYRAAGQTSAARDALARGRACLATLERDHVAPEFRESFRRRNPAHRALLDAPEPGP